MKADHLALAAAVLAVAAGLIGGFAVTGSPGHQRDVRLDSQRIADLESIAHVIDENYGSDGRSGKYPLPRNLGTIDPTRSDGTAARLDPVTHEVYEYALIDGTHYRLCATFATAVAAHGRDAHTWPHGRGRVCYRIGVARNFDWYGPAPPVDTSATPVPH